MDERLNQETGSKDILRQSGSLERAGPRWVERIALDNGLELEIWDLSRILAGDRWLVALEGRMEVPLCRRHLDSGPAGERAFAALKRVYGEKVPYRYRQERHFVDHRQKEKVFSEFLGIVKKNLISYLSHPDFERRLVVSKYAELKKKRPDLFFRR